MNRRVCSGEPAWATNHCAPVRESGPGRNSFSRRTRHQRRANQWPVKPLPRCRRMTRRIHIGTRVVTVITRKTNHPGITRARSSSMARMPSATTCVADTLKAAGAAWDDSVPGRSATVKNSVSTGPGHRAVQVTPVPRSSARNASLKLVMQAFVAAYTAIWGRGSRLAIEETFRIAPLPRTIIPGRIA